MSRALDYSVCDCASKRGEQPRRLSVAPSARLNRKSEPFVVDNVARVSEPPTMHFRTRPSQLCIFGDSQNRSVPLDDGTVGSRLLRLGLRLCGWPRRKLLGQTGVMPSGRHAQQSSFENPQSFCIPASRPRNVVLGARARESPRGIRHCVHSEQAYR